MSEPLPPTRASNMGLFLLLALLMAGVLGAIVFFNQSTGQQNTVNTSGFNFMKPEADRPPTGRGTEAPRSSSYSQPDSSLTMIRSGPGGTPRSVDTPAPEPPAGEEQPQPFRGRTPAPADAPPRLSPQDQAAIKSAIGDWNAASATALGSDMGLLLGAVQQLYRAPTALKYVLDNDTLIGAVMNQNLVKNNCGSSQYLRRYFLDARAMGPQGVSKALDVLLGSTRYQGATEAILGSKLVQSTAQRCPSISGVTGDTNLIKDIFTRNPKLAQVVSTPAIVVSLNNHPATQAHMNGVLAAQAGNLMH